MKIINSLGDQTKSEQVYLMGSKYITFIQTLEKLKKGINEYSFNNVVIKIIFINIDRLYTYNIGVN